MSANYRFPLVLFFVSSLGGVAFAQYDELVTKVPSSANVLVLMNAEQVKTSPAVVREELTSMETKTFSGEGEQYAAMIAFPCLRFLNRFPTPKARRHERPQQHS